MAPNVIYISICNKQYTIHFIQISYKVHNIQAGIQYFQETNKMTQIVSNPNYQFLNTRSKIKDTMEIQSTHSRM